MLSKVGLHLAIGVWIMRKWRANPLNISTISYTSWVFFFSDSIQIYIMCTHVNTTTLYKSHINITINENNKFILKYHIKILTLTSLS